jgi:hypothetical protein
LLGYVDAWGETAFSGDQVAVLDHATELFDTRIVAIEQILQSDVVGSCPPV